MTALGLMTFACGPAPTPTTGGDSTTTGSRTGASTAGKATDTDPVGEPAGGGAEPRPTAEDNEVARLEAIAEEKKRDPEVILALGVAMARAGDRRGAVRQFKRATRLSPKDYRPHYNLGLVLLRDGNFGEALQSLEQAARLSPRKIAIQVDLAVAQRQASLLRASLKTLRRVTGAKGKAGARVQFNLGLTLELLGRSRSAVKAFQRAAALDPSHLKAPLKLGVLLMARKDLKGAARAFRGALTARPNNVEARFNLGMVLLQLGDNAGAAEHLGRAAVKRPADGPLRMDLGLALSRQGDHAAAVRAYRTAARLLKKSGEARLRLGFALARTGEAAGAEKAVTAALRIDTKLRAGLDPVVQELARAEKSACALALIRAILAVLPDDKVARHNRLALESMLKRKQQQ